MVWNSNLDALFMWTLNTAWYSEAAKKLKLQALGLTLGYLLLYDLGQVT